MLYKMNEYQYNILRSGRENIKPKSHRQIIDSLNKELRREDYITDIVTYKTDHEEKYGKMR